jgi:acetyl esterase/lipase
LLPLLGAAIATAAVERLPVADFARDAAVERARLSPDGRRVAFVRGWSGRPTLHIADLDSKKVSRLDLGRAELRNQAPKEVAAFEWVSPERLVVTTAVDDMIFGLVATDWDGARPTPISGWELPQARLQLVEGGIATFTADSFLREIVYVAHDKEGTVLMLDRHEQGGGMRNHPDVVRVNTHDGRVTPVLKNPGEVAQYGFDYDGVARYGVLSHGDLAGVIYRESEQAPWQTLLPLGRREGQLRTLGFDAATNRLIVGDLNAQRRWAIFPLEPATKALGEPLLSDPEYDMFSPRFAPAINGIPLAGPVVSRHRRSLVGIRYYDEAPRVKWLDPEYAKYQVAVDRAMPDTVNMLVNESLDGRRLLWLAYSDQDPGLFFLMDREKKAFVPVGTVRPWIKPAQMAPMLAIKYAARDGLVIHGYLTVPVGHAPKGLPLVVMPHGGPWVRDVWGFNPLVQLLANRGYAVLQVNYRGSTGYGDELYQQARREIGGRIQDDIEDGTRWAIATGVADPRRVAIMGASYGGYSTLFALGHNPELYRCGISVAGVSDWLAFLDRSDIAEYKSASRHWREQLGDPESDRDRLRAVSPVNFAHRIVAPLLIVQGRQDQRVPYDQAKRLIAALEKAGRSAETHLVSGMGHDYGDEKQRTEIYTKIVAFLEKHLGPGVP